MHSGNGSAAPPGDLGLHTAVIFIMIGWTVIISVWLVQANNIFLSWKNIIKSCMEHWLTRSYLLPSITIKMKWCWKNIEDQLCPHWIQLIYWCNVCSCIMKQKEGSIFPSEEVIVKICYKKYKSIVSVACSFLTSTFFSYRIVIQCIFCLTKELLYSLLLFIKLNHPWPLQRISWHVTFLGCSLLTSNSH